jgi:predicted KAP-like P-loop ATPase
MYSDKAIDTKNDDKLNRQQFAEEIADGLVNTLKDNNQSIVLGLNGEWGSGKSSLLNLVISEVEKASSLNYEKIIIIEFNPWMFSGQKELQLILLKELLKKFNSPANKVKGISSKLAEYVEYLRWVKYLHSGVGELVQDSKGLLEKIGSEKDIVELKKDIDKLLIDSETKLYITIDDIDRLNPNEVVEIFKLVKLNASFANTVFILAYDREVVIESLRNEFAINADRYLEKIIQVDYSVPNPSRESLMKVFQSKVIETFATTSHGDLKEFINEHSKSLKNEHFTDYFKNIRDINRFINSIQLRLPSIYKEVNIIDFLQIEALRIFDISAYNFIVENKEALVYREKGVTFYSRKNFGDEKNTKSIREVIGASDLNIIAKSVLNTLFSGTKLNFAYSEVEGKNDIIRGKRVSSRNFFNRYFNLQLEQKDISEEHFTNFLRNNDVEAKIEVLKKIEQEDKLSLFFEWINIKTDRYDAEIQESILTAYLEFSKEVRYGKSDPLYLIPEIGIRINSIAAFTDYFGRSNLFRKILLDFCKNDKLDIPIFSTMLLLEVIEIYEKIKNGRTSIHVYFDRLFIVGSSTNEGNEAIITDVKKEAIKSLKKIFHHYAKDIDSLNFEEQQFFFKALSQIDRQALTEIFEPLFNNPEHLINYIRITLKNTYFISNNKGTGYPFAEKFLRTNHSMELISEKMEALTKENLNEEDLKIYNFFMKQKENGFKEENYLSLETLEIITSTRD